MDLLLTPNETVTVVNQLERTHVAVLALERWQLRYFDTRLGIVRPGRDGEEANASRLYSPVDVALLRVALRVIAARGHRQAWGALTYLRAGIRSALTRRDAVAIVFRGGRAELMSRAKAKAYPDRHDLLVCAEGVERAMRAVRKEQPAMWTGWRWTLAPAVVVEASA